MEILKVNLKKALDYKIVDNRWAYEVIDIQITIELALIINNGRNKDSTVRRTCNNLKHRMTSELKAILNSWSKADSSFGAYSEFMDKVGL